MAPVKKSKSVNKGFTPLSDISPSKDEKFKQKQKRKLSDMLGPQWSRHELERFYDAYRKYNKDWKKVSSAVRSRSIEMVEALYNMNRAYLSLPEGTASVVGLIAMMTDHYNVMGGSGSEIDGDEPRVVARKPQKHLKSKVPIDTPREDSFQRQSIGSSDKCVSLLKMHCDGIPPYFPVRKRTPRVPVSCLAASSNKKSKGLVMNANNDEVSRGALLLREERKTLSSLHSSQATYRETECIKPSSGSAREKLPFYARAAVEEESTDGSLGGNEATNGDVGRYFAGSVKSAFEYDKGRRISKKDEVELSEDKPFNGIQEADNFVRRGPREKAVFEDASSKFHRSTSDDQSKRNKKLMIEDERAACDALQTLAEMSLMMPYLAAEPAENFGDSVSGRDTMVVRNAHSALTIKDDCANKEYKKKRKASKVMKVEQRIDDGRNVAENQTLADEELKSADSSGQISSVSKKCRLSIRSPDVSSSNDHHLGEAEVVVSSEQAKPASEIGSTSSRKNRRKRDRKLLQKDRNYAQSTYSSESSSLLEDRVQILKEKFSNSLSWHGVRKWCVYEWFYSAIDYPWFAKKEFVEYLNHVGLGHIPRLARVEWGVIRSSLGKPRRFSKRFLHEEREKLEQYRESVRTHYANLRAGLGEGLPTDLAHPLSVGQQVVAIHPKMRECHNGSVLTVDRDNCLVQFDCPDLGVELVMDTECMPLNPVENMPEVLRRQKMSSDYWYSQEPKANGAFMLVSKEHMQKVDSHMCIPAFNPSFTNDATVKPASMISHTEITGCESHWIPSVTQSQCCNMGHTQPRKVDVGPVPGLTQSLDRKALEQLSTCPGKSHYRPQYVTSSGGPHGAIHSLSNSTFGCQETAPNVTEIVEGSRAKAQRMVDIAIKAISLMKEGEDAFGRIGEALDSKAEHIINFKASMVPPSNTAKGSLPYQNPVPSSASETRLMDDDASGMKSADGSGASDLQLPSNLITSCVATLLMIQTCTERQYPPAEVAQILDNAVTSLHPCCCQNLSIYRELQMCMGRIKTQILALVPT